MREGRWFWGPLGVVLATVGCGCGGLVRVQGVVKLDDLPVEGAVVVFTLENDTGHPAASITDAQGVFHLTTYKTGDGAMPGQYKVTIMPPQRSPGVKYHEGMTFGEAMEQYSKGLHELRTKPPLPGSGIPAECRDPARTPLRQAVPPDGPIVFELHSEKAKPTFRAPARRDPERPFEPRGGK
ncbi:MAG: carboxypeptidase regulatory-like domain-containing protein [Planctomycetota bacterium]|nr:MAG: carboxypeptidase regulatory-like domain-containing protein [Planctomycetota bacterium]